MGDGGFEPPKALPADLQSVPFGHSGIPPDIQFMSELVYNSILWKNVKNFFSPRAGSALQAEDLPWEKGLSADFLDMFQLLGCKGGVFRCLDVIQNLAGLGGTDEDGGDRFVV